MPLLEEENKSVEKKDSFKSGPNALNEEDLKKFMEALEISKNLRKTTKTDEEYNQLIEVYLDEWCELFASNMSPQCMLECPIGVTYFQKFLTTEMNTENLQAYLDFRTFLEEMDPENREKPSFNKIVEDLDKIMQSYIQEGSSQEINIPFKVKKSWIDHHNLSKKITKEEEIKEWKQKIKTDLYDAMQSELMINISDPFSRFLYDPLFKEIVKFIFSGKVEGMRDAVKNAGKKPLVLNSIMEWDKSIQNLSPLTVVIELLMIMKGILSEKSTWKEDGNFDFDKVVVQKNIPWSKFLQQTCRLQGLDLKDLSDDERKAFFINLFNLLFLHGTLMYVGEINSLLERTIFMKNLQYNVGGTLYSLDSIINNIFKSKEECQVCSLFKKSINKKSTNLPKDETVFFSLIDLSIYSPDFNIYDAKNIKNQLKESTKKYIQEYVQIDHDEQTIIIPPLFTDYYKEFKQEKLNGDQSIKKFLAAYIEIPSNYHLKKTNPSYDLDLGATGYVKKKFTKDKKDKKKTQGTTRGITESEDRKHLEAWSRIINDAPIKKNITVFLKSYQNSFYSSELITWLENNKDAKVDRIQAVNFLNLLFLQNIFIVISGPTSGIADDSKQVIQIQKNIIPLAFGKTLISGKLQKKKRFQIISKKYQVVLYDSGFGIFDGNRLVDSWLFVPNMKFQVTALSDQISFDISLLPYAQMTFSTKSNEERKYWVKELEILNQFVDLNEEKVLVHTSSSWFKKHFF